MGFLGKMKNAITGGGANVSIEYPTKSLQPGDSIHVKVTVISTGSEVKTQGVFVDLKGEEQGHVHGSARCSKCGDYDSRTRVSVQHKTYDQSIPLSGAFTLGANEKKVFEGDVQLPGNVQPTYHGTINHEWSVRGRLEGFGNDPDSGFQTIIVK